jgi:hypothetical protein
MIIWNFSNFGSYEWIFPFVKKDLQKWGKQCFIFQFFNSSSDEPPNADFDLTGHSFVQDQYMCNL